MLLHCHTLCYHCLPIQAAVVGGAPLPKESLTLKTLFWVVGDGVTTARALPVLNGLHARPSVVHLSVQGLRSSDARPDQPQLPGIRNPVTLPPCWLLMRARARATAARGAASGLLRSDSPLSLAQLRMRIGVLYRYVSGHRTEVSPRVPSGVRGWSWSALAMSHPTRSR